MFTNTTTQTQETTTPTQSSPIRDSTVFYLNGNDDETNPARVIDY
jgi:hypothetical protein